MTGWIDHLHERSRSFHFAAAASSILFIACLDYLTGPEVSLAVVYLVPIALAVWFLGPKYGWGASLISTIVWALADVASGATYLHPSTPYWNVLARLGVFSVVTWLLTRLKSLQTNLERLVEERTEALRAEITHRAQLEQQLLEAADQERERIGRDVHDGLGQHLAAAAAIGSSVEEGLTRQRLENSEIRKLTQTIRQAIIESKRLSRGLYPAALELGSLSAALEQLCASSEEAFGVRCRLICEQAVDIEDRHTNHQLFRIAQEAVNNALKHAKPRQIVVALTVNESGPTLIIKDDGKGNPSAIVRPRGMGLKIMAYRAGLIGAALEVDSDPEEGTLVTCRPASAVRRGKHGDTRAIVYGT